MDLAIRVQILSKAVCISHSANILVKGMNSTILLSTWVNSKVDWILTLAYQLVEEKHNSEFKPIIDLERDRLFLPKTCSISSTSTTKTQVMGPVKKIEKSLSSQDLF